MHACFDEKNVGLHQLVPGACGDLISRDGIDKPHRNNSRGSENKCNDKGPPGEVQILDLDNN